MARAAGMRKSELRSLAGVEFPPFAAPRGPRNLLTGNHPSIKSQISLCRGTGAEAMGRHCLNPTPPSSLIHDLKDL
ncbi:hypothetical protein JZ751_029421 [Albula glossodonta]|uniref:Uncharacterized protein n=1 Tax=Albula glossodonta TaxID=121402 RepID=A0A8T2PD36_9TELE|nr:hypothetical protein JZ751_029421 [Albula glossodonta]